MDAVEGRTESSGLGSTPGKIRTWGVTCQGPWSSGTCGVGASTDSHRLSIHPKTVRKLAEHIYHDVDDSTGDKTSTQHTVKQTGPSLPTSAQNTTAEHAPIRLSNSALLWPHMASRRSSTRARRRCCLSSPYAAGCSRRSLGRCFEASLAQLWQCCLTWTDAQRHPECALETLLEIFPELTPSSLSPTAVMNQLLASSYTKLFRYYSCSSARSGQGPRASSIDTCRIPISPGHTRGHTHL